ncbi:hypothetical protein [Mycetocola zhujimingii]|uniref:Uncharacterized protein n=1 Tax=Mycetocola zhujimingii TaxID=2079792 RepID=A0A2U1THT9_9MICO|nr:hypothetical protein [Mycetocola zhujimingii]PWC08464.1 hypothetical protein DF223_03825 [Mycetocola zhujimingii]
MQRSKAVSGLLAAVCIASLASVVGCSTAEPQGGPAEPSGTASTDAENWPRVEAAGTGPWSEMIPVPNGANSIEIDFVCTGGIFSLAMGGQMQEDRSGSCGGTRSYHLPLLDSRKRLVSVFVADDAAFALTGSFSASVVEPDPAITSDCDDLSSIESSLFNARSGLDAGDVSLDEWTASVEQAHTDLAALSQTASGLLAMPVAQLSTATDGRYTTREALDASSEFRIGSTLASQICEDNGTPLTILDEYGG